jgi:hypothetical protein
MLYGGGPVSIPTPAESVRGSQPRFGGVGSLAKEYFCGNLRGFEAIWPAKPLLCCAHANLTRFSLGAPQALTLAGHNSAQSRRATTDRSGLIAINPSASLPPA